MKTFCAVLAISSLLLNGCNDKHDCDAAVNEIVNTASKADLEMLLVLQSELDKTNIINMRQILSRGILIQAADIHKKTIQNKYKLDLDSKHLLAETKLLFSGTNRPAWVSNTIPGSRKDIDLFLNSQ